MSCACVQCSAAVRGVSLCVCARRMEDSKDTLNHDLFPCPSPILRWPPQAKEFGEAEVWMNERLMRAAPAGFAEFVTAFEESLPSGKPGPLWLLWRYEGDFTLGELMKVREEYSMRGEREKAREVKA